MKHRLTRLLLLASSALAFAAPAARAQCDALLFDGVDDVASVPDALGDFDLADAFTLEVWARIDVLQTGGGFVGGRTATGGGAWVLGAGISTPADAVLSVSTPSTDAVFAPGGILVGGWRHYAGTFDGNEMKIYLDGALVATKAHPSPGSSSPVETLLLGRFPAGTGLFMEGALDEVRIWDVVRTADEILGTYLQPLTGAEPGLVGYYKFDEGGGDAILDSSLRGNDGFLGGTAGAGPDDPQRVPSGIPFNACTAGTPYCFGDGSGSGCPCGNAGGAGEGCANSTGAGALLEASGTSSVASDDLTFAASNLLPNQPALLFLGENAINGGNGVPFGDGLRCAGMNVIRLGVQTPDGGGNAGWGPGLAALAGLGAGDVRDFQCWYRDPSGGPCGSGFNLSNGVEVGFLP